MSWTIDDFKSTSLEVGQWCWGTLEGSFSEKQTISQIIVDAVIGMIPLVGDVTAVRDLLAVGIDMSSNPKKRQEVMQWVLLVILLFALIPVVGGVIKGVGKLALRVVGDAAKDTELLSEVVQFLNRMGHGDAPQWLKTLDISKYQPQILSKCKDFCATVQLTIKKTLQARVGQLLPDVWRAKLERVGDGFQAVCDLADEMIPQAFKELNLKLKALQNLVYRGELHEIATGGMPKIKREAEAYLEERKLAREIRQGKYPSTKCLADNSEDEALIRAKYQPMIDRGWPNILFKKTPDMPTFKGINVFESVAAFHGEITAIGPEQLAGKKIYRAYGNETKLASRPGGSYAGGGQPAFWGIGDVPENAEKWRIPTGVLDEWNGNGFVAILHFPSNLVQRMPEAKAWSGLVAEQFGQRIQAQYLEGGGQQLVIDLGSDLPKKISAAGEILKHPPAGQTAQPFEKIFDGIRVEFRPTNWTDVEGIYGYSKFEDNISGAARTRRLASDEIQTKVTNSKVTAAARAGNDNRDPAQ